MAGSVLERNSRHPNIRRFDHDRPLGTISRRAAPWPAFHRRRIQKLDAQPQKKSNERRTVKRVPGATHSIAVSPALLAYLSCMEWLILARQRSMIPELPATGQAPRSGEISLSLRKSFFVGGRTQPSFFALTGRAGQCEGSTDPHSVRKICHDSTRVTSKPERTHYETTLIIDRWHGGHRS